ncbi:MAG: hypothetical protein AB9856_03350 [Cellulosilyticaceae bacterium]
MTTSKRHYRVVQRDKEALDGQCLLEKENVREFVILGIIMYIGAIIISSFLGYFIGKNN